MTTRRLHRSHFTGVLLAGALLAGALLVVGPPGTPSAAAHGACTDATGVPVVVDFTDLGGSVEIGCAEQDPATGRAALLAAGFVAADSQPGLLCTINSEPDPCPTTFQGSYWSYWHSTPDGEWTSYQVGADASDPAPGELEGWRYNDGATGPGIAPSAVADSLRPTPTATTAAPAAGTVDSVLLFASLGFAALVAVLVILFLLRVRSRRASGGE